MASQMERGESNFFCTVKWDTVVLRLSWNFHNNYFGNIGLRKKNIAFLGLKNARRIFQGKTTFCKDILVSMGKNDKIILLFKEKTLNICLSK